MPLLAALTATSVLLFSPLWSCRRPGSLPGFRSSTESVGSGVPWLVVVASQSGMWSWGMVGWLLERKCVQRPALGSHQNRNVSGYGVLSPALLVLAMVIFASVVADRADLASFAKGCSSSVVCKVWLACCGCSVVALLTVSMVCFVLRACSSSLACSCRCASAGAAIAAPLFPLPSPHPNSYIKSSNSGVLFASHVLVQFSSPAMCIVPRCFLLHLGMSAGSAVQPRCLELLPQKTFQLLGLVFFEGWGLGSHGPEMKLWVASGFGL